VDISEEVKFLGKDYVMFVPLVIAHRVLSSCQLIVGLRGIFTVQNPATNRKSDGHISCPCGQTHFLLRLELLLHHVPTDVLQQESYTSQMSDMTSAQA